MDNNLIQIGAYVVQIGLLGFVANWAKSAFIDRTNDHEKRIQKLENFMEFYDKHLKEKKQ